MNLDGVIDSLIQKYTSGNLIPILGCELFKVDSGDGNLVNIHEYIIKDSFHSSAEWPEAPKLLSELPLAVPDFDYNSLLGCYKPLTEKQKKIKLLKELASLRHFNVFLVATVFKEFEMEFRKINSAEEIEVYKNTTISMHGLPSISFNNKKRKIIYLFDNLDSSMCALTDEQLLESMYLLANSPKSGPDISLLSHLKEKTLLFIGCDFPDWFMRYCIRVLSNDPITRKAIYIVNDHPPKLKYQEFFFSHHNISLIQTSPVDDFIDKFYRKALKKEPPKYTFNSRVFISYSKKHDFDIAKNLYYSFRENGVEAYFDEESKVVGNHENNIKDYILNEKTKVMVSVISKNLIEKTNNIEYNYIRDVEWYFAKARNDFAEGYAISRPTIDIVPYFVDNERDYFEKLPPFIQSEFRFGEFHGGFQKLFDETKKILV